MSWESSETKFTCPCGSGTYTETHHSNDWGQSRFTWEMDCPSCKLNYSLHTYDYYEHGMRNEGYRWIKKPSYDKAMELLQKANELKDHTISLAKNKYLDVLVAQFENSSKKAVWEVLHANIKRYKSLGTFYNHTNGKNKYEYLGELFCDHYLDDVLKILHVKDKEVRELRTEEKNLEKAAERLLCSD